MKRIQFPTQQVSNSSLAFARIAFGLIMVWETLRYFDRGWIDRYYIAPDFYFTYLGFDWVQPWGGEGMYIHFFFLGILALFVALGFLYRLSSILFFLAFTYIFLLDKANYLNHFYLISLMAFLFILLPLNRSHSIDGLLWPKIRRATVGLWAVWSLRFLVGIAYFYGGIAKLNADWLTGEPMRTWLRKEDYGSTLSPILHSELSVYFISYGGLLFDLGIVPLLLWRKTRILAFLVVTFFHLTNAYIFSIGIFPWMMIALTTIFFEPDWAERVFKNLKQAFKIEQLPYPVTTVAPIAPFLRYTLLVFVVFNLLVPLRHLLIPSNAHWTEEGHRFSWHMKLRDKKARVKFKVSDTLSGKSWTITQKKYLSKRQRHKMAARPDMILQFAHHLQTVYRAKGYPAIKVTVDSKASLNARPKQTMVDPSVDLTKVSRYDFPAKWILPMVN